MADRRWKFWRWLADYATTRLRERYMHIAHHDRSCFWCKRWISESYGAASVRDDEAVDWIQHTGCKACGRETPWDMRHAIPFMMDPTRDEPTP